MLITISTSESAICLKNIPLFVSRTTLYFITRALCFISSIHADTQHYNHFAFSGSVLSKTAIFPKNEGRKREISNESARGSSLRKANVQLSAKGAPHDGQDTVNTLRTIIWYKRLCIGQTTRQPSAAVQPFKKDVKKNSITTCRYRTSSEIENSVLEINHVTNVTKVLNKTTASDRVSRSPPPHYHTCKYAHTQHYQTIIWNLS